MAAHTGIASMSNIILLAVCFLAGAGLRRIKRLPEATPQVLNAYIINVALPALALLHIHRLTFSTAHAFPVAMAWLLYVAGIGFFWLAARLLHLSKATTGCLILCCALGNTSFVGLPMIEAFYGRDAMGIGMLCDQPGSFLVLSTLGLVTAAFCAASSVNGRTMARRIVLFPPLQAMVVAVLLKPVAYPPWLTCLLERVGDSLAPLALVSVGCQMRLSTLRGAAWPLCAGLAFKLVIGPVLVALVFAGLLHGRGDLVRVTLFEAAMPPMITGAIVAMDHELDPPLAALALAIGIPVSFLTLPAWHWLLQRIC